MSLAGVRQALRGRTSTWCPPQVPADGLGRGRGGARTRQVRQELSLGPPAMAPHQVGRRKGGTQRPGEVTCLSAFLSLYLDFCFPK